MGVIFKNSVMYSGDINQIYNGMNIDYSTILYSNTTTSFQSPLTYTASKDCIVYVAYNGSNSTNMRMLINNQQVTPDTLSSRLSYTLILDKNDTIQSRYEAGNAETCYCTMKIYPIIYPTKDILPIIYSEEEREIGCWTDGKPLYQRTLFYTGDTTITVSGNSSTAYTVAGITNIYISDILPTLDQLVHYQIDLTYDGNEKNIYQFEYGFQASTGTFIRSHNPGINYIGYNITSGSSITLQYTKTTDQPGSGQWTPQEIPAQHYSTNEQVVGTWIDGSAIYEKTVVVNSGFSTSMTVNHGIANIDKIIGVEGMVETSYPAWLPLTDNVPVAGYNVTVEGYNRTSFSVYIGSSRVTDVAAIYITIRYTKSTS